MFFSHLAVTELVDAVDHRLGYAEGVHRGVILAEQGIGPVAVGLYSQQTELAEDANRPGIAAVIGATIDVCGLPGIVGRIVQPGVGACVGGVIGGARAGAAHVTVGIAKRQWINAVRRLKFETSSCIYCA